MKNKEDRSLLIVDDDKAFRDLLRYELERNGYRKLYEGGDGEEALDVVMKHHVDLVLLDLRMPKLEGEEVLKFVKENYPKIRVIILTGHPEGDTKKKVLGLGADAYLEKPYDSEELLTSIAKALEKK